MVKHGTDVTLSIPLHDLIKQGTLGKHNTDAGLSVEEFKELLEIFQLSFFPGFHF
jgi:hypothetical protein